MAHNVDPSNCGSNASLRMRLSLFSGKTKDQKYCDMTAENPGIFK
jgi:hypothetical protein